MLSGWVSCARAREHSLYGPLKRLPRRLRLSTFEEDNAFSTRSSQGSVSLHYGENLRDPKLWENEVEKLQGRPGVYLDGKRLQS